MQRLSMETFQSPFSSIVDSSSPFNIKKILIFCVSSLATTLAITLGLFTGSELSGYHPENIKNPVNRALCTCDCWDGFYRGLRPRGFEYKTFYINYELQTILLVGILLFYAELLRHFLLQLFVHKHFALVMLLPSVYSNFYGIWNVINYLNDHDYHRMLSSQLFFTITELVVAYTVCRCLLIDKTEVPISPSSLYLVVTICYIHLLLAAGELNIMFIFRNTGLLASDLINITWATILLVKNEELRPDILTIGIWIVVGLVIFIFYFLVTPFRG